jgi:dTDP-glucose 4,6-dehydratase
MRVLLTGGAGFVGHHIVEHLLKTTDWEIVLLDRLDLSGNLNRVHEVIENNAICGRLQWVYHDFKAPISNTLAKTIGRVDGIIHAGASTHVDRSIIDPLSFVYDNVVGTANILEFMKRQCPFAWMIYFSTDEVFGPAAEGVLHNEWDNYNSGNPYAASKAGGEELCLAYANTYQLDIRISHCMNIFGERQHAEKFIPLVMKKVLANEKVLIHADATKQKSGSRFYIHARNVADAVLFIIQHGHIRDKYNIVGAREVTNLDLAMMIAAVIGKPLEYELVDFHSSRPGHDLRYALDGRKLQSMGWRSPIDFEQSLQRTIEWTLKHPQWL